MVNELCHHLVQHTIHEQNDAHGRAHTTQSLDYTYDNMNTTVNALTADWMVGAFLWRALGDALQRKVQDVHKEHMPSDSGGLLQSIDHLKDSKELIDHLKGRIPCQVHQNQGLHNCPCNTPPMSHKWIMLRTVLKIFKKNAAQKIWLLPMMKMMK